MSARRSKFVNTFCRLVRVLQSMARLETREAVEARDEVGHEHDDEQTGRQGQISNATQYYRNHLLCRVSKTLVKT